MLARCALVGTSTAASANVVPLGEPNNCGAIRPPFELIVRLPEEAEATALEWITARDESRWTSFIGSRVNRAAEVTGARYERITS